MFLKTWVEDPYIVKEAKSKEYAEVNTSLLRSFVLDRKKSKSDHKLADALMFLK